MTRLLSAEMANDVIAIVYAIISFLAIAFGIVYFSITRVRSSEVDRLQEGRCPFTGRILSIDTLVEKKKTRKKVMAADTELVLRFEEDGTIRGGVGSKPIYYNQTYKGTVQECFYQFELGYSVIFTQKIDTKYRNNSDCEGSSTTEMIVEKCTYTVKSYGKLGLIARIRLKKICKKACFSNSYDA